MLAFVFNVVEAVFEWTRVHMHAHTHTRGSIGISMCLGTHMYGRERPMSVSPSIALPSPFC